MSKGHFAVPPHTLRHGLAPRFLAKYNTAREAAWLRT